VARSAVLYRDRLSSSNTWWTYNGYIQDGYAAGKWRLNGGVRYDGYDMTGRNNTLSSTVKSDFINYNGGIVFKPVPIGSLYAAYATLYDYFGRGANDVMKRLKRLRLETLGSQLPADSSLLQNA